MPVSKPAWLEEATDKPEWLEVVPKAGKLTRMGLGITSKLGRTISATAGILGIPEEERWVGPREVAEIERMIGELGGRDIYTAVGELAADLPLMFGAEAAAVKAFPWLARGATEAKLLKRFTEGAIREIPGVGREVAKDITVAGLKASGRLGVAGTVYGAATGEEQPLKEGATWAAFGLIEPALLARGVVRSPHFRVWSVTQKSPEVRRFIRESVETFGEAIPDEAIIANTAIGMGIARARGETYDAFFSKISQRLTPVYERGRFLPKPTLVEHRIPFGPERQIPATAREAPVPETFRMPEPGMIRTGLPESMAETLPLRKRFISPPETMGSLPPPESFAERITRLAPSAEQLAGGPVPERLRTAGRTLTGEEIGYLKAKEKMLKGKGLYISDLFQEGKGMAEFLDDGRALIRAFQGRNMSTFIHEMAHVWRRKLPAGVMSRIENVFGVEGGIWTREAEENFAKNLESYFASGRAPTAQLKGDFQIFRRWMRGVYDGTIGSPLDEIVSPEVRRVFDKAVQAPPKGIASATVRQYLEKKPPLEKIAEYTEPIVKAVSNPRGTLEQKTESVWRNWFTNLAVLQRYSKPLYYQMKRHLGVSGKAALWAQKEINNAFEPVKDLIVTLATGEKKPAYQLAADLSAARVAAIRIGEQGKQVSPELLASYKDIMARQSAMKSDPATREIAMRIEEASNRLGEMSNKLWKYAFDKELITEDVYKIARQLTPYHVPLQRILTDDIIKQLQAQGKTAAANSLQRFKGSLLPVRSVEENLVNNAMSIIQMGDKNVINTKIIDFFKEHPDFRGKLTRIKKFQDPLAQMEKLTRADKEEMRQALKEATGKDVIDDDLLDMATKIKRVFSPDIELKDNQILIRRGGVPEVWQIDDDALNVVFNESGDYPKILNVFLPDSELMQKLKSLKRIGVTIHPVFMTRNAMRDFIMGILNDPTFIRHPKEYGMAAFLFDSLLFPVNMVMAGGDWFKALAKIAVGHDKFYEELIENGAKTSFFDLASRVDVKRIIEDATRTRSNIEIVFDWAKDPFRALESVSMLVEQTSRYAVAERVYKDAIAQGLTHDEAIKKAAVAFRSMTADFGEMGAHARIAGKTAAFFTAQFSGLKAEWEAFKEQPARFMIKATWLATIPSVVLWLKNKDERWYKDLLPIERNMYWHVNEIVKIPKPYGFAAMIMGSSVERLCELLHEKDPASLGNILNALAIGMPEMPIPSLYGAAAGIAFNKNLFFNTPVSPKSIENLPKWQQYKESTSEVAKVVGRIQPLLSPVQVDFIVSELAGTMGRTAMKAGDIPLEVGGVRPSEPFYRKIPGAGAFLKKPAGETTYGYQIQLFYDNLTASGNQYNSASRSAKEGKLEDYQRTIKNRGWQIAAYQDFMNDTAGDIGDLIKQYQAVKSHDQYTYLSPKEKSDLLKEIGRTINELALATNRKYNAYRSIYSGRK